MVRLRLHGLFPRTRANGPGVRFGVWFQGCDLGCPGCFNPATHPEEARLEMTAAELVDRITAGAGDLEGVTLSGGEPFQQPEGLLELARELRRRTRLSILVFSGYTRLEIEERPRGREILASIDVLIDGRYAAPRRLGSGLRGSANQRIHLLTDRYTREAFEETPPAEVSIAADGTITVSGVDPLGVDV